MYVFRKIHFGLCNAPATVQRCMMDIFIDMVEKIMEVSMDDFSVVGNSFDDFLVNLMRNGVSRLIWYSIGKVPFHGT